MSDQLLDDLVKAMKALHEMKNECTAKQTEPQEDHTEEEIIIRIKDHAHDTCKKLYPSDPKHKFYRDVIQAYQEFCERVEELAEED